MGCVDAKVCRCKIRGCEEVKKTCASDGQKCYTRKIYTTKLLHTDGFTQKTAYTQMLLRTHTHTQKPLHAKASTHRHRLLHTDTDRFQHKIAYTQTLLHTEAFTQNFYTRTFLHTDALKRRNALALKHFNSQQPLHTEDFTRRSFYTQALSHTKLFTHRKFHGHFDPRRLLQEALNRNTTIF